MGFQRTESARIILRVEEFERALLVSLAAQLCDFIAPDGDGASGTEADPLEAMVGIDPNAQRPQDPALARLLPDAYLGDDEASDEFRRFTERSLRETKLAHASTVQDTLRRSGDTIVLSPDEAMSWLGFLNDARITLGVRIEITEDNHEELAALADDDPRLASFQVYDWLTYLQDSLIRALEAQEPDDLAAGGA